ncbi:tetratricopeptide repeat protein [Candidatus Sumerlaeota bacterium]|nr:tetratricopeptide repeat protein [Candidatus Sumerlaeota bacterium]
MARQKYPEGKKVDKKTDILSKTRKPVNNILIFAILITVAVLISYSSLVNAGFIWDDDDYVTENRHLRTLQGLRKIWFEFGATHQYYPLVHTSFWMEYHLWKLNPLGYHLVNILLHSANAILLWLILRKLGLELAWIPAALFALHPVHVESVAWITERKNVLSGFFYLSALLCYIRFSGLNEPYAKRISSQKEKARPDIRYYVLALIFYLFALFSKTVVVSLPAAILLLIWWKNDGIYKKDVYFLIPFFGVGLCMGLITVWMEKHHVGAQGVEWDISIIERCLIAGRALWFYACRILFPYKLTFIYPRWEINAGALWQYIFPSGVIAVVSILWIMRKYLYKGPFVAILFFSITLMPALGFFDIYPMQFSFVADHFQYLASIGLIVLYTTSVSYLLRISLLKSGNGKDGYLIIFWALVLFLSGFLTWKQSHIYRDMGTLWRDTLAKNPNAWIAHINLSTHLIEEGKLPEARYHAAQAIKLKSDQTDPYNNLGNIYKIEGNLDQSLKEYLKALEINPQDYKTLNNLGVINEQLGDIKKAIHYFSKATEVKPNFAKAHYNLGLILVKDHKFDQGVHHYSESLKIDPDNIDAYFYRGVAYETQGGIKEAMSDYSSVLRLNPNHFEANLFMGNAFKEQNNLDDAKRHYLRALKVNSQNADVLYEIANIDMIQGKFEQAKKGYYKSLEINPDFIDARYNLAYALEQQGNIEEALKNYRQIRRLQPDNIQILTHIAWILATNEEDSMRNVEEAIRLAEKANQLSNDNQAIVLDTLAAAYAEAGKFEDAVKTAEKAYLSAKSHNINDLMNDILERIKLYKKGKPYRESVPGASNDKTP